MPQTRSRSRSQRRITDNDGNTNNETINRVTTHNHIGNMRMDCNGSTVDISNNSGSTASGSSASGSTSNSIGSMANGGSDNGSSHSLDIEINQGNKNSINSKVVVQIYKGFSDKLSIDNWFKRFELIAKLKQWNDNEKIIMLGNFLEDDALNWYLENCETENWFDLKSNLIARFSLGTVDPMTDFVNFKYDFKLGMKHYFERKRQLGVLAKLSESQIVPIMVQGLHPKFKSHFIAVQPKTYIEFYRIAKAIEDNLNESFKVDKNKNNYKSNVNDKKLNDHKIIKKKPPSACRICERLGFNNRFHWASDCKNKNKKVDSNQNTNTKQVNVTERNDDDVDYPILQNINLN